MAVIGAPADWAEDSAWELLAGGDDAVDALRRILDHDRVTDRVRRVGESVGRRVSAVLPFPSGRMPGWMPYAVLAQAAAVAGTGAALATTLR